VEIALGRGTPGKRKATLYLLSKGTTGGIVTSKSSSMGDHIAGEGPSSAIRKRDF